MSIQCQRCVPAVPHTYCLQATANMQSGNVRTTNQCDLMKHAIYIRMKLALLPAWIVRMLKYGLRYLVLRLNALMSALEVSNV